MNQITFGDQRLQTPDQFYRSIFPDRQNLSYSYPSPAGASAGIGAVMMSRPHAWSFVENQMAAREAAARKAAMGA